jgi:hypothetical protein
MSRSQSGFHKKRGAPLPLKLIIMGSIEDFKKAHKKERGLEKELTK